MNKEEVKEKQIERITLRIANLLKSTNTRFESSSMRELAAFIVDDFFPRYKKLLSKSRISLQLNNAVLLNALMEFKQRLPEQASNFANATRFKSIIWELYKRLAKGHHPRIGKGHKKLIYLLGRKHKPKFKLTKSDGSSLSPELQEKAKSHFASHSLSFSPVSVKKLEKPKVRASREDGRVYERDLQTTNIVLWRELTPSKTKVTPTRIRFFPAKVERKKTGKTLSFDNCYDVDVKKNAIENFEFTVSKKDILDRIGAKREISQIKLMGGVSAINLMEELGVIIEEKQRGRDFHYAHRRVFCLKGLQAKENLDPTTAGSNYDTLFKVEKPICDYLCADPSPSAQVKVEGQVHFEEHALPFKVIYKIFFSDKKFLEVTIDTLNHRVPTVEEHLVADKMYSFSFSC